VVYDEVLKGSGRDVEYDTLLSDYLEFWSEDMNKKRDYLPKHLTAAKLNKRYCVQTLTRHC